MIKKNLLSLLILFMFFYSFIEVVLCFEIDATALVTEVIDGDTFDVYGEDTIRLADIDCPESGEEGYQEAKDFLTSWISSKPVYLDIDDIYRFDSSGNRIVCVVYAIYNSTHLLNINKLLLNEGHAVIDDNDNEFDPNSWSLYVPSPNPISSPTPNPTASPTPTSSPTSTPTPTQTPQPSNIIIDPLVLGLVIIIAILTLVILVLIFKKR